MKNQGKRKDRKKEPEKEESVEDVEEKQEEEGKPQKFSLYALLQVEKTATIDEIKKSYKKLVLKVHPDKNKDDPEARNKFAKLSEAYQILTDPQKRAEYDQTGTVGDDFNLSAFQAAYHYFRQIYKPLSPKDIEDFASRYIGGQMQAEDLRKFYLDHNGDITFVLEHIPLSTNADVPRFIEFFEKQFKEKLLVENKSFKRTKNKIKLLPNEEKEVEKEKIEMKKREMQALVQVIQNKGALRRDFLEELQKKYGGKKTKPQSLEKRQPVRKLNKK